MTATPLSAAAAVAPTSAGSSRFGRSVRRAGQLFGLDLSSLFSDEGEGEDGVASGFEGFVPEFAIRQQRIGRSPSTLQYKAPLTQPGEAVFRLTEQLPSAVAAPAATAAAPAPQATAQAATPAQDYSAIFSGLTKQISDLSTKIGEMGQRTQAEAQPAQTQQTPAQETQPAAAATATPTEQPRPTYASFNLGDPKVGGLQSVNKALEAGLTPREITSQARQADVTLTPAAQTQVFRNVDVQQFNQQGPALAAAAVNRALESGLRPGEIKKAAEAQGINLTQKAVEAIRAARK